MKSQSKIFVSLLVVFLVCSCATEKREQKLLNQIEPQWGKRSSHYQIISRNGEVASHLFFDGEIGMSKDHKTVNAVPLALAGTKATLALDLVSGRRFYDYEACSEKDLWKKSKERVDALPFSLGFVPRMLDQLGQPQKILIYGGEKEMSLEHDEFYRVRLLGAFVEEECLFGECMQKTSWLGHLVLVGVFDESAELKKIKTLDDLKKEFSWAEAKYALENLGGGNLSQLKLVPRVKVSELRPIEEMMPYLLERNIHFTKKEMSKLYQSCTTLFDHFYEKVGKMQIYDLPSQNVEEVKAKVKKFQEARLKGLPAYFHHRLAEFLKKYQRDLQTCSKFLYTGNINENQDQFWFLSYMSIFLNLHQDGFFYECHSRNWNLQASLDYGKSHSQLAEELYRCQVRDIDYAFVYLEKALANLEKQGPWNYRFIDYDNHPRGTHQKMYHWVKTRKRHFDCSTTKVKDLNLGHVPQEKTWQPRWHQDKQLEMGIVE